MKWRLPPHAKLPYFRRSNCFSFCNGPIPPHKCSTWKTQVKKAVSSQGAYTTHSITTQAHTHDGQWKVRFEHMQWKHSWLSSVHGIINFANRYKLKLKQLLKKKKTEEICQISSQGYIITFFNEENKKGRKTIQPPYKINQKWIDPVKDFFLWFGIGGNRHEMEKNRFE